MRPPTPVPLESPSFAAAAAGAQPYELKFLVSAELARCAEAWARARMAPDPNTDASGVYTTTTLYLDTPALDMLHRTPSYRRRKFRIRRYASNPWLALERKTRSGDLVRKRRSPIAETEADLLAAPDSAPDWPAHWFHRRILARNLVPSALVTYTRTALAADSAEGPLRLTIDREIRGLLSGCWRPAPFDGGRHLLPEHCILELKFLDAMPSPFKALVAELNLAPASISKYRVCREAWAAAPVAAPARSEVSRA